MSPENSVAVVTGANSGIGLATAVELARRGHRVVGTVRTEAKGADLERAAHAAGTQIGWRLLDVTDADRGEEVIAELRPTVLVNNAGYGLSAPVELVPDEDARLLLDTMLLAPIRLARLALPGMREAGGGHIVNISSILGRVTLPLSGWYQAAKHGLEAVSDALRAEVAGDGIHVTLVEPGFFKTSIFDELDDNAARYDDGRYAVAFERSRESLERFRWAMGEPEKVARVVARVVSSSHPPARTLVGPDARWLDAVNPFVPARLRDRLARYSLGL